uniref:Uncharacterized protein n=1 Tax=Anguilla anguilla TaxID=7936 RepID=A0A0E9VNK2_ANGAN
MSAFCAKVTKPNTNIKNRILSTRLAQTFCGTYILQTFSVS